MAAPKTVTLSVNDVLQGLIDGLQASKNLIVSVSSGGVDIIQEGAIKANGKIDEAIDTLQKMMLGD